jgi:hypothetical protein
MGSYIGSAVDAWLIPAFYFTPICPAFMSIIRYALNDVMGEAINWL